MDTPLASRLDPTLKEAIARRARTVELTSDAPAELLTPQGPLVGETFAANELEALLRELTPPPAWQTFEESGKATFPLLSRHGHFLVSLWRDGESLRATIQPTLGGAQEAAPPKPPAFTPLGTALVAVLIIVGAIALVLLPIIYQSREPITTSLSLGNTKKLALATLIYAQDHGDVLPGWARTPDGRYTHNVWDEQIAPRVKSNAVFKNKNSGFKSPSDPRRERVLTYGFNGWLLVPSPTGRLGDAFAAREAGRPTPSAWKTSDISDPAGTILLAELATEQAVRNGGSTNFTLNLPNTGGTDPWNAALGHWIDISPREWVENGPTDADPYDPNTWDPTNGIARDFYGGGGNYAFVDGHVQFMKIGNTVGLGKTYRVGKAEVTVAPGRTAWSQSNTHNLWNPNK